MKKIIKARVTFEIESPVECTEDEMQEWIYYSLGYVGSIKIEPLGNWEFEVERRPIIRFSEALKTSDKNDE